MTQKDIHGRTIVGYVGRSSSSSLTTQMGVRRYIEIFSGSNDSNFGFGRENPCDARRSDFSCSASVLKFGTYTTVNQWATPIITRIRHEPVNLSMGISLAYCAILRKLTGRSYDAETATKAQQVSTMKSIRPFARSFLMLLSIVAAVHGNVRPQSPGVWDALDTLRGKLSLPVDEIQELFYNVQPGVDFPIYSYIPETGFSCDSVHQPGYYADTVAKCQVFRRCDIDNVLSSYLCSNMTLFNQITLVCDWWFNVDCGRSKDFYDYSNSRLYQGEDVLLLDDQFDYPKGQLVPAQTYSRTGKPYGLTITVDGHAVADSEAHAAAGVPVVHHKKRKSQLKYQ